jgi:hypothetical protein
VYRQCLNMRSECVESMEEKPRLPTRSFSRIYTHIQGIPSPSSAHRGANSPTGSRIFPTDSCKGLCHGLACSNMQHGTLHCGIGRHGEARMGEAFTGM